MSGVVEKPPSQHHTCHIHGNNGLQSLKREKDREGERGGQFIMKQVSQVMQLRQVEQVKQVNLRFQQ